MYLSILFLYIFEEYFCNLVKSKKEVLLFKINEYSHKSLKQRIIYIKIFSGV